MTRLLRQDSACSRSFRGEQLSWRVMMIDALLMVSNGISELIARSVRE